jgi:hypothetical protein
MTEPHLTVPAIAERGVLVHIGMHKTGTTAIQSVLAANRDELERRGVTYPGPREAHHLEARSLTGFRVGQGGADAPPPPEFWAGFAAGVAAAPGRVVVSSEFFSRARGDHPGQLVRDLGTDRTHVVVGVRNLIDTGVSTWQQTLKQGRMSTIDRWAAQNIPRGDRPAKEPDYWEHWNLGAMVERWAEVTGPERMTVVVLDAADRTRLPSTFEALLGLPPGFLAGRPAGRSNRGMTAAEAELVRRLNVAARGKLDWPAYRRLVRQGVITAMVEGRAPDADEPRPVLPAWAQESMHAAGRAAAETIRRTGVRVVGDLAALYQPASVDGGPAAPAQVPLDAAVQAVAGALGIDDAGPGTPVRTVDDLGTRELARVLAGRVRRAAARRVRR